MSDNPYFNPKSLLGLGKEPTRPRSRWEFELDSFDANELGRSQLVPVVTSKSPGEFKELARVQVAPEASRDWVITLGPLSPGSQLGPFQDNDTLYAPPNILDAVALVQWSGGQQGAPAWALVDWWAGSQFSVFGSSVRVSGAVITLATAVLAENNVHMLTAHLAPGRSNNIPRRTVAYPQVAAGGDEHQPIPAFAQSFTFSHSSPLLGTGDVGLTGELISAGVPIWFIAPIIVAGVSPMASAQQYRIPIGTNFVGIFAPGATAIPNPKLLYDLALS